MEKVKEYYTERAVTVSVKTLFKLTVTTETVKLQVPNMFHVLNKGLGTNNQVKTSTTDWDRISGKYKSLFRKVEHKCVFDQD